jgi:hypothetical protein
MPSYHALLVLSMAQILVLRSSNDKDLVAVLARAFAATKVKGLFENRSDFERPGERAAYRTGWISA